MVASVGPTTIPASAMRSTERPGSSCPAGDSGPPDRRSRPGVPPRLRPAGPRHLRPGGLRPGDDREHQRTGRAGQNHGALTRRSSVTAPTADGSPNSRQTAAGSSATLRTARRGPRSERAHRVRGRVHGRGLLGGRVRGTGVGGRQAERPGGPEAGHPRNAHRGRVVRERRAPAAMVTTTTHATQRQAGCSRRPPPRACSPRPGTPGRTACRSPRSTPRS